MKVGYVNLPQIGFWWLDRYVDFTDDQEARVREDLARLHAWHREEELPRIAALLRRMEQLAPGDIDAAQACRFAAPIRARMLAALAQAEPPAAALATGLSPQQLRRIEAKFASKDADYRREWVDLPPDERTDKRYRLYVERAEMIYGTLDDAQRDVLRAQVRRSVFDPARTLLYRQRRQQDMLASLRTIAVSPQPLAASRAMVHDMLVQMVVPRDPEHRAYLDAMTQEACDAFAAVHNTTTPPQRDNAVRRLRAWQRDARELAGVER